MGWVGALEGAAEGTIGAGGFAGAVAFEAVGGGAAVAGTGATGAAAGGEAVAF